MSRGQVTTERRRTASQRAADATKARVESGGRVLRVILRGPARRALDRITAATGETMTDAVERLLLAASPPTVAADPDGFIAAAQKSRQG